MFCLMRINKYQQRKKSAQKIHKILAHKIHQAPTEFFSETLRKSMSVAFRFTKSQQKSVFRTDLPTCAKKRETEVYYYENFTSTGENSF